MSLTHSLSLKPLPTVKRCDQGFWVYWDWDWERKRRGMKIKCSGCEAAEAEVICCADEAALCLVCDDKIHKANKLASKHQRIRLFNSTMPKCDICQDMIGYFFCLEDRALLCRKCDFSIHTANAFVSGHQRFLLTGARIGLEPIEPVAPTTKKKPSVENETTSQAVPRNGNSIKFSAETRGLVSSHQDAVGGLPSPKVSFSEGSKSGSIHQFPLDEFLGLKDTNANYGPMEHGSFKVDDDRKHGDSEWSPILRATYEDLDIDDCLNKVPEIPLISSEDPSTSTGSALFWQKNFTASNCGVFVPDICHLKSSSLQNSNPFQPNATISKRQRL